MSSVIRNTRAAPVVVLLCAGLASGVRGATPDDELLVDPTVPLGLTFRGNVDDSAAGEEGLFGLFGAITSYELSSVLIRSGDRIAVINAQRVRVGDKVDSAVVASIEPDDVTLNVGGEILTL